MRVVDWEKWQSYRKDRGQPPWIKVHRRLLRNLKFLRLPDAAKGQLLMIWLLAADHDGAVIDNCADLKMLLHLENEPDIQTLVDNGFLTDWRHNGVNAASTRRQGDALDQNRSKAEERRGGQNSGLGPKSDLPDLQVACSQISERWRAVAVPAGVADIRKWSDKRKTALKERLKDPQWREDWTAALDKVAESSFLRGLTGGNWKADIDWFLRPDSVLRIMEGKYDDKKHDMEGPGGVPF